MADRKKHAVIDRPTRQLRWLGWTYILLLLIEGALRKWFLPGFSDYLLLVRDPVVLYAYFLAFTHHKFPANKYVLSGFVICAVSVVTALVAGHGNPVVAAFGFRANYLHIPFAFIIGSVFNRDDVIRIGKWWLWGSLLMTALIVMQFYSPQSSWVNRSVGGIEGAGFSGALGRYRPPGTFSFIVGVVWFYAFTMAFLVAGITQHNRYSKLLLALGAMAIFISVPVSISRSLILISGLIFAVGMFASTFQRNALKRFARIILLGLVGFLIASQLEVFDEAKAAFLARWERSTNEDKGGVESAIIGRTLTEFIGPFVMDEDIPFLGKGIGAGTQVGAKLLTGERGFDLGEAEWFRLMGEGGMLLGFLYISWRVWLTITFGRVAFKAYRRGNGMALIFFTATAYNLLIGQFGQSTINGFTIVGMGLTLASMRLPKSASPQQDVKVPHQTAA